MNRATAFLTALTQAMAKMTLYHDRHPSRERAVDLLHRRILELQEETPQPHFTFMEGEVIHQGRAIRGLKILDWSQRFLEAGIQRLELIRPVTRDDLDVFLEESLAQLIGTPVDTAVIRQTRESSIRYGVVTLDAAPEGAGKGREILAAATLGYSLADEADAVGWLHQELKDGGRLQLVEAEAVIRSLSVAMHGDRQFLIPLLRLKEFDQYTTTHALNVSVLAMALAEFIGLGPKDVRSFGIAGLLHDLGKTMIPEDILNKPGKLTDSEREVIQKHTVEGARIILETEENLDMAAIVAYEHHICLNGTGYPTFRHARTCHHCSNMIHICDVFDALRTKRPYRDAWDQERVISYISEGAGTQFDPELASAFVRMMSVWESRLAVLDDADAELPSSPDAEPVLEAEGQDGSGGLPVPADVLSPGEPFPERG